MTSITKIGIAALMLGGAAVAAPGAANAEVSFGISLPGVHIWTGGYDYGRPCSWYRYYDVPAPRRCYGYLESYWGGNIYVDGDFIFRDRDDYGRWRDRPAYQHWRNHDFAYRADKEGGQYGQNRDEHGNMANDRGSNGDWNRGNNNDRDMNGQSDHNNPDTDHNGNDHDRDRDHDSNGGGQ